MRKVASASDIIGDIAAKADDGKVVPLNWWVDPPIDIGDGYLKVVVNIRAHNSGVRIHKNSDEDTCTGTATESYFIFRRKEIEELIPNEVRQNPYALPNAIGQIADLRDYFNKSLKADLIEKLQLYAKSGFDTLTRFKNCVELLENRHVVTINGTKTVREKPTDYFLFRLESVAKLETLLNLEKYPVCFGGGRY